MKNLEENLKSALDEVSKFKKDLISEIVIQEEKSHYEPWVKYTQAVIIDDARNYFDTGSGYITEKTTKWEGPLEQDIYSISKLPWYERISQYPIEREEFSRKIIDQQRIAHPDKEKREHAKQRLKEMSESSQWYCVRNEIYRHISEFQISSLEFQKVFQSWLLHLRQELADEKTNEKAKIDLEKLYYFSGSDFYKKKAVLEIIAKGTCPSDISSLIKLCQSYHYTNEYSQRSMIEKIYKRTGSEIEFFVELFFALPNAIKIEELKRIYDYKGIEDSIRIKAGRFIIERLGNDVKGARGLTFDSKKNAWCDKIKDARKQLRQFYHESEFENIRKFAKSNLGFDLKIFAHEHPHTLATMGITAATAITGLYYYIKNLMH